MQASADSTRLYRRIAWTGAWLAFGLIVLGGVVRITGSGMGCGDHWPKCNGHWFPPFDDITTVIEWGHRWVAALLSTVVIGFAAWGGWRYRGTPALGGPALLAGVLLVVQVLLGPVIVKLDLPRPVVVVHLLNAMALLAVLMVAGLRAAPGGPGPRRSPFDGRGLGATLALLGLVTLFFGAMTANYNAGLLCLGFPLCNGSLAPPASELAGIHWTHRMLAFTFAILALVFAARVSRLPAPAFRSLRRSAWLLVALTAAQIGIAAAMVLRLLPPTLRALHLMAGTAVWMGLVLLVYRILRTSAEETPEIVRETEPAVAGQGLFRDLVSLTKPRIISLLLVTTLAPMFITGAGLPSAALVLWVVIGGYLMAGGANAINMWFDRDIDTRMSRTKLRPIPSGRLSPGFVLGFGTGLGAAAFGIFYFLVNPLAAWLALGGLLFYVLVYTMWLKRSSPQNIVIGGAAGAFPPLVGWTAVTGHLDLPALYLFAIVFYWTPPHFWALALIKQKEYANARIPMMPVVRGERQTKIQMLGYTLMLIPLTVLPWLSGTLGWVYLAAALLLGARLLWYCLKLLREESVTPTAWKMYKYSLAYLFLLFAAMGVDRAIPLDHPFQPTPVMILKMEPTAPSPAITHTHN